MAQGGPGRLRPWIFLTFWHYKGGRSSAQRIGRLYPRRNPWYSLSEAESTSEHMVLSGEPRKKSRDTTGNRSRDRPTSTSWLYLINKSCVCTEYIILLVVNVNCLTRKMKLNIALIVAFVFRPSCSAPCCRQFLREGTNIPVGRKVIDRSCARFFNSAADMGVRGGEAGTNYWGPTILHI